MCSSGIHGNRGTAGLVDVSARVPARPSVGARPRARFVDAVCVRTGPGCSAAGERAQDDRVPPAGLRLCVLRAEARPRISAVAVRAGLVKGARVQMGAARCNGPPRNALVPSVPRMTSNPRRVTTAQSPNLPLLPPKDAGTSFRKQRQHSLPERSRTDANDPRQRGTPLVTCPEILPHDTVVSLSTYPPLMLSGRYSEPLSPPGGKGLQPRARRALRLVPSVCRGHVTTRGAQACIRV